jgi:tetratricopeptide (TPR) repeat protein
VTVAADEPTSIAQVLVIIVNNRIVTEPTSAQVSIVRAAGGCPPVDAVRKGVPLCKGDRLTTAAGVKVKIAFGDPKDRNEVTVGSQNEASEITISSTDCGRICQFFCSFTNTFTNRTQRVAFTNRGTVYEVKSEEDLSATLIVYDGEVDVTKVAAEPTSTPSATEPAATSSPSPTNAAATVTVNSLSIAVIDSEGNLGPRKKMTDIEVCQNLAYSTDAEIALHTIPAESAGNVAKFPNYPDIATRNGAFKGARCDSFIHPLQPINFETLGYVYNDWGSAEEALAFFKKAIDKWRAQLPNWTPRDRIKINLAIAYRQLGQYDEALAELEPMVTETEWIGAALNVRGSISYDKARKVLIADRTEAGTTQAKELLERADVDYQSAAEKVAPSELQYVLVNRAQVLKTRGDIAQRLGDLAHRDHNTTLRDENYKEAEQHYIDAINALQNSYGRNGNNPRNKLAGLLVGRARAALANTYAAMGKSDASIEYYTKAEDTYNNALKEDNTLAAAYCGLASIHLIQGKPDVDENYRKCVAFNVSALVTDVDVPYVVGLRRAAAIQTLAEVGLEPEIVADGETVESQYPQPPQQGEPQKIKIGTKVKLTLTIQSASRE